MLFGLLKGRSIRGRMAFGYCSNLEDLVHVAKRLKINNAFGEILYGTDGHADYLSCKTTTIGRIFIDERSYLDVFYKESIERILSAHMDLTIPEEVKMAAIKLIDAEKRLLSEGISTTYHDGTRKIIDRSRISAQ